MPDPSTSPVRVAILVQETEVEEHPTQFICISKQGSGPEVPGAVRVFIDPDIAEADQFLFWTIDTAHDLAQALVANCRCLSHAAVFETIKGIYLMLKAMEASRQNPEPPPQQQEAL